MRFINVNSQEHRELMIKAIRDQNVYLIKQLKGVVAAGCTQMVILDTFLDVLMYTSIESEEEVYEVITDPKAIDFPKLGDE